MLRRRLVARLKVAIRTNSNNDAPTRRISDAGPVTGALYENTTWSTGCYGAGDPDSEHVTDFYDIHIVAKLFVMLSESCAKVARELDVECVDLASVLPPDLCHYYDFAHVTPLGAQVVARRLVQQVLR